MKNLIKTLGTRTFIALVFAIVMLITNIAMIIGVLCLDTQNFTMTKYYTMSGGLVKATFTDDHIEITDADDMTVKFCYNNDTEEWSAEVNGYLLVLDPEYRHDEMKIERYSVGTYGSLECTLETKMQEIDADDMTPEMLDMIDKSFN